MSPNFRILGRGSVPKKPYTVKGEYDRLVRNGRNLLPFSDSENIDRKLQELNERAGLLKYLIDLGHGDERYFNFRIVTIYPENDITTKLDS